MERCSLSSLWRLIQKQIAQPISRFWQSSFTLLPQTLLFRLVKGHSRRRETSSIFPRLLITIVRLGQPQIFATQIPASTSNTFTRLTNNPVGSSFGGIRPLTSETRKRMAFSLGGTELGGGNADSSTEVYYLLTPTVVSESATTFSFFTG